MSSGVGIRLVCFAYSCSTRSSRRATPRPVFAETVTTPGRWRRRSCDPRPHVLDLDLADVPLGEDDERRAVGLARHVGDGQVLVDEPLARVDEDERDVRPVGGVERAQLGVVLDPLPLLALAAQPGRVDEDEGRSRRARRRCRSCRASCRGRRRRSRAPRRGSRSAGSTCRRSAGRGSRPGSPPRRLRSGPTPGRRATIASSRSPVPWPCRAESGIGSPSPNRWNSSASTSRAGSSILFASRKTGLRAVRRISATSSSPGVIPIFASTTNRTRSASATAARAWSAMLRVIGDWSATSTPPGVDQQEAGSRPLADELLPVARHAGRLVDDGRPGAGQPVDERRLADVREADDGDGPGEWRVHRTATRPRAPGRAARCGRRRPRP